MHCMKLDRLQVSYDNETHTVVNAIIYNMIIVLKPPEQY